MKALRSTVSSKGQIVIPAALRRHLHINAGTRVVFREENDEIRLIPMTKGRIQKMQGVFKREAGESGMLDELLQERRAEIEREDGRWKP